MPLTKEDLLLEEYKCCIELRKHEDERKASLLTTFFLIQGGLFTFYGWLVSTKRLTAIMLSVLAILFCLFWFLVMERMRAFIVIKVKQLQQIEKELGVITTVTNEEELRSTAKISAFKYKLPFHQRLFSVRIIETILPVIIGLFWLLTLVSMLLNLV